MQLSRGGRPRFPRRYIGASHKEGSERQRTVTIIQGFVNSEAVTLAHHLIYVRPPQRFQDRRYVFTAPHTRDKSRRKVDGFLNARQVTLGSSAPDRNTVQYVGEYVGLYQELEDFWSEIMPDFVKR